MSGADDRVIVIGAGFAGLSAAVRLATEGRRVTVLEATSAGGGRSRSFHHPDSGLELDNGQHLMMGCYRETLSFLRTIGTEDGVFFQRNLEVNMLKPGGGRVSLQCPALPAPFHLAAGLLTMRGLGIVHKASAMRAGLLLRGEVDRPDDNETCDAWLRRMGQTQGIRGAFWDPLIWAVLNDDPLVASAAMLVAVLERAFLGTRDGSRLGVPRVPLSRLYVDESIRYLHERDSEVRLGHPVRQLELTNGAVSGVTLRDGETLAGSTVISAIPPFALLDTLPEATLRDPVFQDVAELRASPIVNVWLFLDRAPFREPFIGLIGSPMHWMFNRNAIEGRDDDGECLLNVTISAARSFIDDPASAILDLFRSEMARYFPGQMFEIHGYKVVKEKRATISHAAGTYQRRPPTVSPVGGLYLAGDWVRTGLPATIESACQSGHEAAAAALEGVGPSR